MRKIVDVPKEDSWSKNWTLGTPALNARLEDVFPYKEIQSLLLLKNYEIRRNNLTDTPENLSLGGRPACQALPKLAPEKLKALPILSVTTAKILAVELESLKPY